MAVTAFIKAITNVFTKYAHHDSYWKDVAIDTEMNVSSSVIGYRDTQLKLSPVLNQITARMTMLPGLIARLQFFRPFCSRNVRYDSMWEVEGQRVLICDQYKLGNLHLKQLASYINEVSTTNLFSDVLVVGLL